jgi:hypothetical protein
MEAKLVRSTNPEIIVHSWDDSREPAANPPVYIPKSYVTKRSKGLTIRRSGKDLNSGHSLKWISFHEPGHKTTIDVVGDLKHDDMRAVAVYALEFEDMLSRTIGGPPSDIPFRIRFYADQSHFRRVARLSGADNAMSYYNPQTRDIVMWFDKTISHEYLQELLAHEFTHAYGDIIHNCISPLWFAEGLAEYFQHFTWKGDHAEPGAMDEKMMLNLINAGGPIPLERFITTPRDEMYGRDFQRLYAQAWTLVHYLVEYEPEKIQELLRREPISVQGMSEEWKGHLKAMMKLV